MKVVKIIKERIRQATMRDIAILTELRMSELQSKNNIDLVHETMTYLQFNLNSTVLAWIVELNNEPIGTVFVEVNRGLPTKSNISGIYGQLQGVYIKPEHRNRTLGTVLITEVVTDLRDSEFTYLQVEVNDDLIPLFKQIGFKAHGRLLRLTYHR